MIRVLLLVVLLAGCAGPRYADMQAQEPLLVFSTQRAPAEYAACLTPKLADIWNMTKVLPDGDAQVVSVPMAAGMTGMILTVTARPGGRVEYREMNRPGLGRYEKAIELVQSCL